MPIRCAGRALGLLTLILLSIVQAKATDDVPAYEGPAWPAEEVAKDGSLPDKFQQFDRALEYLRDQLAEMRQEIEHGPAGAQLLMRRNEPGFRGLYTMDRNGTHVQFLTAAPGMISSADPQWSHDGGMVAFGAVEQSDAPLSGKFYVYAMEGPFKGKMRDYGYGNTPAWSRDDKRIAYMINPGNPINAQAGTWIMDTDGTHRRWVAPGWYPRFSPDGKKLVCHGYQNGSDLLLVDLENGSSRELLNKQNWNLKLYGGNWSPDGKKIVFVAQFENKDRMATIDIVDDSIRTLYTNDDPGVGLYGPPAWSPDGKQIVFSVQDNAANGPRQWWHSYLYSIAAEPTEAETPKLVEGKRVGNINRGMTFSPDGKKLMFSSER